MSNTLVVCPECGAKNRIPEEKRHLGPKCGRCSKSLKNAHPAGVVITVTDADFHQIVEQSHLPVVVDFYSPTCGPCRTLAPVIVNLAQLYAGKVLICKVDTSIQRNSSTRFQIRGVPCLLFFRQGKVVDQVVGAVPQQELEQRLNAFLKAGG